LAVPRPIGPRRARFAPIGAAGADRLSDSAAAGCPADPNGQGDDEADPGHHQDEQRERADHELRHRKLARSNALAVLPGQPTMSSVTTATASAATLGARTRVTSGPTRIRSRRFVMR
jgi:hypothetical protein